MREKLYQRIYTWSLKRWREQVKDPGFKKQNPKVSTHALIRYAERFDGYDFEQVESALLTREAVEKIQEIGGNGKFAMNGILYFVKDAKIITVAKAEGVNAFLSFAPMDRETGKRWTF